MKRLLSLFVSAFVLSGCASLNVLIYSPTYGRSHTLMNARIANTLSSAGFNVTVLEPEIEEYTFSPWNVSQVLKMKSVAPRYAQDLKEYAKVVFATSTSSLSSRLQLEDEFATYCEAILKRRSEFEKLREMHFDVAFTEMLDLCGMGVIHYLGIRTHVWFSTTSLWDAVAYELGVPSFPSYVPVVEDAFLSDKMNFLERFLNFYMWLRAIYVHRYGSNLVTSVFRREIGVKFPDVRQIASRSALAFVNSDPFVDVARPLLHKVIYVGGIGIPTVANPLNPPFDDLMKQGAKGIVLFSLGTTTFISSFPDKLRNAIFKVFSEFREYQFVVKLEEGDRLTPEQGKHLKNVHFFEWIPQSDMLAHGRVAGMITHGGYNGVLEAAKNGVPVVAIPLFADQFRNARILHDRRWGVAILKSQLSYATLKASLDAILNDPSYKAAAVRLSRLIADSPRKGEDELIRWTHLVARYGPLPELRPAGTALGVLAYFGVDVLLTALVVFPFCVILIFCVLRPACRRCLAKYQRTIKEANKQA